MTFIDEALKNCHSGEEFVQAMASVYEYPEVRNNLKDYPEWIRNIIAIVDYDTELQMEGLECKFYHDVIKGCVQINWHFITTMMLFGIKCFCMLKKIYWDNQPMTDFG